MDFARVLREAAACLAAHQADWAVIGGLALAVHGAGRLTLDVDIAAERRAQDFLVAHLESLGYETLHRSDGYSSHAHPVAEMGRIDVVYVDPPTAKDLFGEAEESEIFPGVVAKVPRPEHLVAMKVLAAKNDPSRQFQELADIVELLRATGVDAESVRVYFERHDLLDEWKRVNASL